MLSICLLVVAVAEQTLAVLAVAAQVVCELEQANLLLEHTKFVWALVAHLVVREIPHRRVTLDFVHLLLTA
jgi:hypothetical protein